MKHSEVHESVLIRNYTKHTLNEPALRAVIYEYFRYRKLEPAYVEIIIAGKQRIQTFNKTFRNHNTPTDVLSFPVHHESSIQNAGRTVQSLGSIVICPEIANSHQKDGYYGQIPAKDSILFLVVHGLLHLQGLDHESEQEHTRWDKIVKELWSRLPRH